MSDLQCITDDLEEEIILGIRVGSINLLPPDFNRQSLALELSNSPVRMACLIESSKLLLNIALLYTSYAAQLTAALGIKPSEAESRLKNRAIPEILKKMEEK